MIKKSSYRLRGSFVAGIAALLVSGVVVSACSDTGGPRWNAFVLQEVDGKSVPFTDTITRAVDEVGIYLVHSASIRLLPAGVFESAFKIMENAGTPQEKRISLPTGGTYIRENGRIDFFVPGSEAAVMSGAISGDTLTLDDLGFGQDITFILR